MSNPTYITQTNLSLAWAEAFVSLRATSGHRLSPLMLTFSGFAEATPVEVPEIRTAVDATLAASGMQKVQTVANTIFPLSLWRLAKGDRQALYAEYRANLPEYVAFAAAKNRRGLYFARLIGYDLDPENGEPLNLLPDDSPLKDGNQLEFIIEHCKKGVRNSMFQASIFDPRRDHSSARQLGFPCLQHLTFVTDFKENTLQLNAFYATQQLFEKGYGNFLGLARLAAFVASQVGLTTQRITCFVGIEKMESAPKAGEALDSLLAACDAALAQPVAAGARE